MLCVGGIDTIFPRICYDNKVCRQVFCSSLARKKVVNVTHVQLVWYLGWHTVLFLASKNSHSGHSWDRIKCLDERCPDFRDCEFYKCGV